MNCALTVFTPTYNRAHTLGRTYESLCRQTCREFTWLIIDDGSTDGTAALVATWQKENRIPITYIYQENQGMHGAHNTAYRHITTELNTCIDSDDWMPDDAVEHIINCWREHGSDKVAGIVGLDQTADGNIIGTALDRERTSLQGFYERGGTGDKKLVYRTEVITATPDYPTFEGERYVGLAYKYMLVDRQYELIALNKPLVTVEYQPDGSSHSMYRQYWNNPRGFAFYRKTEMMCASSLKRRFIVCAHYVASSIRSGNRHFIGESPRRWLTALATPVGALLYLYIRHQVRHDHKMKF